MSARYASSEPTRSMPRGGRAMTSWLPQFANGGYGCDGERRYTDLHDHLGGGRY